MGKIAIQRAAAAASLSPVGSSLKEVYRHNLELAETNKTLLLLRKIDETVLGSVDDQAAVMQSITTTIAEESGFPFAVLYLRDQSQALKPQAAAIRIGDPATQSQMEEYLAKQTLSLRHAASPVARSVHKLWIVTTERLFEVLQPCLPIDDAEAAQERLSLLSFYVCPLQVRGAVIGVLVMGSPQLPGALGYYQKSLLERLAAAVGVALDSTLLYAQSQESAAHLRAANRHLKELDRAKDEFISMASHQLRTPLTGIKGYLSMLLEGDAGALNRTQREFLESAYNGSQRMAGLIGNLLSASRVAAGKFVIEKRQIDLHKMIAQEVEELRPRAEAKHVELQYQPPASPLALAMLDEEKTHEVVMNFIDNAIYYTHKGKIEVTLEQTDKAVEFRVKDTGIGVPADAKKQLFTKFFRAANARRMRPDGTGLGLFLAKRIIEEQGGTMIFESSEGKGSTFGFAMPLSPKTTKGAK